MGLKENFECMGMRVGVENAYVGVVSLSRHLIRRIPSSINILLVFPGYTSVYFTVKSVSVALLDTYRY
jgi:hypothetical protein